jgi:hypothetical protein
LYTHLAEDNKRAEIKYSSLKAAFKYLQRTFGDKLLMHFKTDPHLQAGQAAAQVGVLMNHFRRITKNRNRFNSCMESLTKKQQEEFLNLYAFYTADNVKGQNEKSTPRKLKLCLSNVSVDSTGFPKIPSSACSPDRSQSVALDVDGFPLTPPTVKGKPSKADQEALDCSPPPVSKVVWHGSTLKRPASAKEKKDTKAKKAPQKKVVPKKPKGPKGTGNFKINSGTVIVAGGKQQTYLQHRPDPTSSLQLIVSITSKMVAGSTKSHYDLIQQLLPLAKKAGTTKADVVNARNKLLNKLV